MTFTPHFRGKYRPLSTWELEHLLAACSSPEQRLVVSTLAYTGMRINELARLNVRDVDFHRRTIRVVARDGRSRIAPLSRRLEPMLSAWFALRPDLGMSLSTIHRHIVRAAARAGLGRPVTSHLLRVTFGALAAQAGVPPATIIRVLGHRSRTMYRVLEERDVQPIEDAFREW